MVSAAGLPWSVISSTLKLTSFSVQFTFIHEFIREPQPTMPFYIKKAMSWLKANRSSVCKISADKGYGPTYISAGYTRKQYLQEINGGAFTEISQSQLMWSMICTYDQLRAICEHAICKRLIDVGTMNFILQQFHDLGVPNPTKAALPLVLSCMGKLRSLVKLHKPGCKLRRVEVDTRSPFNNLTVFVSSILRQLVSICETTVMDSKQVLLDLIDHPPPLELEAYHLVFVAADLEDFYPRMNLESLQVSLRSGLDAYYGVNHAAKDFVAKLVLIILHNKAVLINGKVYRKARSLSIGERIATDSAHVSAVHSQSQFMAAASSCHVTTFSPRLAALRRLPLSPWHRAKTGPLLSRRGAVPLQLFCDGLARTVSLFPCFPAISSLCSWIVA